jgi:hypothetical protein
MSSADNRVQTNIWPPFISAGRNFDTRFLYDTMRLSQRFPGIVAAQVEESDAPPVLSLTESGTFNEVLVYSSSSSSSSYMALQPISGLGLLL